MPVEMLRLFIAIELPESVRRKLAAVQEDLQNRLPPKTVRWTRPEGIHLTLKFLGDTPEDQVEAVGDAMTQAAAPFEPCTLQVAGLGCFPNPRAARVLWVGLTEVPRSLTGVHRATELQLSRLGWEREKRPFDPHLTLGRVNKGASRADRQVLAQMLANTQLGHLGTVSVTELVLFRSQLQPSGAVYTVLARAPLGKRQASPS